MAPGLFYCCNLQNLIYPRFYWTWLVLIVYVALFSLEVGLVLIFTSYSSFIWFYE